jgi:hypothetical protein
MGKQFTPLRNLVSKITERVKKFVEYPTVDIIKATNTSSNSINPFDTPKAQTQIIRNVPCIVSSQPEIVVNGSNLTTKQSMYIFIHEKDYDGDISLQDRFIFEGNRYRPVEIQHKNRLYGLWKIKVEKES